MLTWLLFLGTQGLALRPYRPAFLAFGVALFLTASARAQGPSIQNGCGGSMSPVMAQTAEPYYQAVVSLTGAQTGWCAMATEHDASSAEGAAMWEFVSAAYVMHAMQDRRQITPAQQAALQRVLASAPGMGKPPTRLRDIDTAFYVFMRTLAAKDDGAAQVTLDGLQQHAPAIYRTLVRRSVRWGDSDDN